MPLSRGRRLQGERAIRHQAFAAQARAEGVLQERVGEPILQGHPLLRLENAVCTPHIGYVEQDSYEHDFSAAFDNVVNFIAGEPTNIVNPEALKVIR